jgi:cytochrome c5
VGDWAAWKPRIEKGLNTLYESAITGHGGMPARGGMAKLTDGEIKKAIEYMFNAGRQAAPAAAVAVAAAAPGKADADSGRKLYDASCSACHAAGVAGAPKFGDKVAWAARASAGVDALTASVLKGKGAMPPKGGAAAATDAEIGAAVQYMLAQSK